MKRAQALLILAAMFALMGAQGCERSNSDQLASDVKEVGHDAKRGVQDALD